MADVGAISHGSLVAQALGVMIDLGLFRVVSVSCGLLPRIALFLVFFVFGIIQSGSIGKYCSHCLYSLLPHRKMVVVSGARHDGFPPGNHAGHPRFGSSVLRSPDLSRLAVDHGDHPITRSKNLFDPLIQDLKGLAPNIPRDIPRDRSQLGPSLRPQPRHCWGTGAGCGRRGVKLLVRGTTYLWYLSREIVGDFGKYLFRDHTRLSAR